jgi:uncharacterized Zn-binding protein involved in type VI secretion
MAGAARRGDPGAFHCSPWTIASASSDVIINGRGAARIGDSTSLHLKPGGKLCFPHTAKITQGAATVRINGKPAARVGSQLAGCTRVTGGSGDVDIGGPSIGGGSGLGFQVLAFALSFVEFPSLEELGTIVSEGGSIAEIGAAIAEGTTIVNPLDSITSVLDSVAGVVTEGGVELIAAPIEVAVAVPTGN